jgi:hypothetical protein
MQLASLTHDRSWGGTLSSICEAFERLVTKASVKSVHGHLVVLGSSAAATVGGTRATVLKFQGNRTH